MTGERRRNGSRPTRWGRRLAAVLICVLPVSCGESAGVGETAGPQPVQWRFAIEEPAGSVQDAYAQKFKQLVETRSNGEIEVVVYPYGTLGTSDQLTEQLHLGAIQFAMASPGHLGKLIPEVQAFLLHFVFSDDPEVNNRALNRDAELRAVLDPLYARKEIKLLSIFSEGWQVWTTDRPVRHPEDFEGLKMRVMTSPFLLAAYEAYGASPTPLPYGEVYGALQLNMIDGQENPVFAIQEMSFYEVTEWMIFARHAPFITTVVSNREFFEELPPQRREMLEEIVREMSRYILEQQQKFNRERLEQIRRARPELNIVEELTPQQREAFREASLPVRRQFVESVGPSGQEVLNAISSAVKEAERALR